MLFAIFLLGFVIKDLWHTVRILADHMDLSVSLLNSHVFQLAFISDFYIVNDQGIMVVRMPIQSE